MLGAKQADHHRPRAPATELPEEGMAHVAAFFRGGGGGLQRIVDQLCRTLLHRTTDQPSRLEAGKKLFEDAMPERALAAWVHLFIRPLRLFEPDRQGEKPPEGAFAESPQGGCGQRAVRAESQ